MDILHLVDRLEELFNESRTLPFTRNAVVDEDKMLDLIDQMRVTIPEEVKKAQQIVVQRDRIVAQAQEEAARIVALAKDKADQMMDRETLVRSAAVRADQILAQARADAAATRRDADEYVMEGLRGLEDEMSRLLNQVRNGLHKLEEDKARNAAAAPQAPAQPGATEPPAPPAE